MKTKVCELEGPALEWWFKRATGDWPGDSIVSLSEYVAYGGMPEMFGWAEIGPFILRDMICLNHPHDAWIAWRFVDDQDGAPQYKISGSTPLIATMRCVVLAKFGDEVEA